MLVEDYLRPAAIRAGVLKVKDGLTYGPEGDSVSRFGFHNLRHSLATLLMDEGENPAVVQAILRHSKMDMTLVLCALAAQAETGRARPRRRVFFCTAACATGVRTGAENESRAVTLDWKPCVMMVLPLKSGRLTQR